MPTATTTAVPHPETVPRPPADDAPSPARDDEPAQSPGRSEETRQGEPRIGATLATLPGVGPALAQRILTTFRTETKFLLAAAEGRIDELTRVQGISEARAVELVHAVRGTPELGADLFAAPRVAAIFQRVRDAIVARAASDPARNELRLLGPLAERQAREQRTRDALQAAKEVAGLDLPALRKTLAKIKPLADPRPAYEGTVVLFVDTTADRKALEDAGIDRWVPIALANDPERARRAEAAIYAYTKGTSSLLESDRALAIPFTTDLAALIPWAETERFTRNRASLEATAAATAARAKGPRAKKEAARSPAREALRILARLDAARSDFEPSKLPDLVQDAYDDALASAEERLQNVTLSGTELVRALRAEAPDSVRKAYQDSMTEAQQRLREATGVDLDVFTETVPPEIDVGAVQAARRSMEARGALARLEAQMEAAHELTALRSAVGEEIQEHLAFDARQAIGSWVADHRLTAPAWGKGLWLQGALHLDHSAYGTPVDYRLGLDETGKRKDDARLALLTGANSGGKTTLLETIAQVLVLAHAGLPVPAQRAVVPEVDAIYLFGEARSLSAGAFEDFLVRCFPLTQDPGRIFVLGDELEAMTELEAAAEIVAAFIQGLDTQGAHGVFVSHLANHIAPLVGPVVRIDGIEAKGLDDEDRLVVDRSPRLGYRARSTPEFILTRLARQGPESLRATFATLADRVHARITNDASGA